jgi:hypothetical protein
MIEETNDTTQGQSMYTDLQSTPLYPSHGPMYLTTEISERVDGMDHRG